MSRDDLNTASDKHRSILIVTENFTYGGLETHIAGEIKELANIGVDAHLVVGQTFVNDGVPAATASITANLPMKIDATIEELIASVETLRAIIKQKRITIVHAHPFMSILPAYLAASLENIPCVITLHGPASINGSYGPLYDYMNALILGQSSSVIAVSDELAKMASPYVSTNSLLLQPNVVSIPKKREWPKTSEIQTWLVVARLDEAKITGIKHFIESVFAVSGVRRIDIAGDGSQRQALKKWCDEKGYSRRVNILGLINDIPSRMVSYDGVAGMGRVVLESVASAKRTCIVGYDGVKGMLNDMQLFLHAAAYNFSGRDLANIAAEQLGEQILEYDAAKFEEVVNKVTIDYDEKKTWSDFARHLTTLQPRNRKSDVLVDVYTWLQSHAPESQEAWIESEIMRSAITAVLASHKYAASDAASMFRLIDVQDSDQKNIVNLEHYIAQQNTVIGELHSKIGDLEEVISSDLKRLQTNFLQMQQTLESHTKTADEKIVQLLNEVLTQRNETIRRILGEELAWRDETSRQLQMSATADKTRRTLSAKSAMVRASSVLTKPLRKTKERLRFNKEYKLLVDSGLFDERYYVDTYADLATVADPLRHFMTYGWKEGRRPSRLFSTRYYLATNPDVVECGMNPLLHYGLFGRNEGRPSFDYRTEEYVQSKKPVIAIQLENFDRGGLEEVVLSIAAQDTLNRFYRPLIFDVAGDGGYLASVAEQKGLPVIHLRHNEALLEYYIRECNVVLVHLHYSVFGFDTYKANTVKTIYTIHNNYIWADEALVDQRKYIYDNTDTLIAVSSQVKKYFAAKFHQDPARVRVIPNGVNIASLNKVKKMDRRRLGLRKEDFVLVSVASFNVNKFHPLMVAAIGRLREKYPNLKLVMLGNVMDHAYYTDVLRLIRKYKVEDNIKIIDYMPKNEVLGLLDVSDAFLQPSITEGFSIATIEAMYRELPLIISDVGGARDIIKDDDIGRIIHEPYGDIMTLTPCQITTTYGNDEHLDNLDELVAVIAEFIDNKDQWKNSGRAGRNKVITTFNDRRMVEDYIDSYDTLLLNDRTRLKRRLEEIVKTVRLGIMAPFPSVERVSEGWMSRIRVIDGILSTQSRLYIHISEVDAPILKQYSANEWELIISPQDKEYNALIGMIVGKVKTIYVHTLHLAEYMLPWLKTNKIIVDIHGITPEEEVMMGRSELKEKYEKIEKQVLRYARACVMVTKAMQRHYEQKYPSLRPKKIILLPIVESITAPTRKYKKKDKLRVVYSGGTQAWQNLPAMLDIAAISSSFANFTFLSHDWQNIRADGIKKRLPGTTRYEFCPKNELVDMYLQQDIGLVIRDESPVNRVACPTKLFEYMSCGVIPIVRFAEMGDFKEFGYMFIEESNFIATGSHISVKQANDMIAANYSAVKKMIHRFEVGSETLRIEVA